MAPGPDSRNPRELRSPGVFGSGTRLPLHRMVRKITAGAIRETYSAEDTRPNGEATLAFMLRHSARHRDVGRRLSGKAETWLTSDHPHISILDEVVTTPCQPTWRVSKEGPRSEFWWPKRLSGRIIKA